MAGEDRREESRGAHLPGAEAEREPAGRQHPDAPAQLEEAERDRCQGSQGLGAAHQHDPQDQQLFKNFVRKSDGIFGTSQMRWWHSVSTARGQGERQGMSPRAERRGAPRQRVLQSGLIVYNSSTRTMKCHILDISEGGAKLLPADTVDCPKVFTLVSRAAAIRLCEVVWQQDSMMGVRFV